MTQSKNVCSASVVIPTLGRELTIWSAVRSAVITGQAGEIVVVNDAAVHLPVSDDHNAGSDVVIYDNGFEKGPSGARNFGVSKSTSDIVFFLDDDDVFAKGYRDLVLEFAGRNSDVDYGFCGIERRPHDVFPPSPPPVTSGVFQPLDDRPVRKRLSGLGCGFWIRRTAFDALGGLDTALVVNEDTEFYVRLLAHKKSGVSYTGVGVIVRDHLSPVQGVQGSVTKHENRRKRAQNFCYILNKHKDFLGTETELRQFLRSRAMDNARKTGSLGFCAGVLQSFELPVLRYWGASILNLVSVSALRLHGKHEKY